MDEIDVPPDPDMLVLGTGDLTQPLLEALDEDLTVVIVTREDLPRIDRDGVTIVAGDPADDRLLKSIGIEACSVIVAATEGDRFDALAILTARSLAPDSRIVAAATNRENVQKLERAGADSVISPASISSRILVDSALKS